MELGRITSRRRVTIPKRIREEANLRQGDLIAFRIEGRRVILRKAPLAQDDYSKGLPHLLGEWSSPEDEHAWGDL